MKVRLRWKLMILCRGALFVFFVFIGVYSYYNVYGKAIWAAQEKLMGDMKLGRSYLDRCYPGTWEIRDGKLYKGETLINDNHEAVDAIGKSTQDTVTIFQGNTRVATNVMKGDVRAVGTNVSPEVEETVLKKGQSYIGVADVVGSGIKQFMNRSRIPKGRSSDLVCWGTRSAIQDLAIDFAFKMGLTGCWRLPLLLFFLGFLLHICKPLNVLADVARRPEW